LKPFVKSKVTMFFNAPLKLGKTIGLVLYWFPDGVNANIIANRFNLRAFTMCKYADIVINVFVSKDNYLVDLFLYFMEFPFLISWMDFFCMWPTQCLWCYWCVTYSTFLKVR
jgi:hypothetical protein